MITLLWSENRKLRRSKIVWVAAFATIMVAVIVFAQGQFVYNGTRYINTAGWFMTAAQSLGTFFVLPAVIALLGSYIICREEQENTMNALRLLPIDETRLTIAKMVIAAFFSVLIYLFLFAITIFTEAVLHSRELSAAIILKFFKMYLLNGIGVFIAISPIIAFVAQLKKGYWLALVLTEIYSFAGLFANMSATLSDAYPIVAVFNISGYYDATLWQVRSSLISLILCGVLAGIILAKISKNEVYKSL